MVTFNEEESAIKAIEKYNEKRISILNNARILVKPSKKMCTRSEILPTSTPTLRSGPVPQEYPGKGKGKQRKPNASDDLDGSESTDSEIEVDGGANPRILNTNQIFITGLPSTMSEKLLFDTLWDIFSTVGEIKINRRTRKPMIYLFKQKDKMSQLTGNAMVTFNEEESAIKAIEKYNEKRVPLLKDAQIRVKKSEMKTDKQTAAPLALLQQLPETPLAPVSRPGSEHLQKKKGL
ncbi:unnamed protein product [Rotaria sp. Silwood2]|nr:unnamed protein product [Rotaria sp. Silwood2]